MKKSLMKSFLIAALVAFNAAAVLAIPPMPPGPADPTIDPGTDTVKGFDLFIANTTATLENASAQMDQLNQQMKSMKEQAALSNAVAAYKEKAMNALSLQKKKNESTVADAQTVEECQIADITNEDSVTEAFKLLFTTYPADILEKYPLDSERIKKAYRQKAVEFSNDVMIEAYIVSRNLAERMEELQKDYETLKSCMVDGQSESSDSCQAAADPEDEIGIWSNYYRVNAIYDSLLRITQELVALQAQYEAAQSLRAGITPILPDAKAVTGEQHSFNFEMVEKMAFAQMLTDDELQSEVDNVSAKTSAAKDASAQKTNTKAADIAAKREALFPVKVPQADLKSPFSGATNQFETQVAYKKLYGRLSEAQAIHNLKVQLPSFREIFVSARQIRELHEHVLQKLYNSEQCVLNYLGQYYNNPTEVWMGSGCVYGGIGITCQSGRKINADNLKNLQPGDALCAHDSSQICSNYGINQYSSRGGFSGWLVSAYKVAKAETVLELTEEDFSKPIMDDSISTNVSDLDSLADKMKAEQDSGTADSFYVRPSDEPLIKESLREQELLPWRIGAEGAKALGADMASSSPKWGKITKAYPVWNDEKYFYDAYLSAKYENLKSYVRGLDMRSAVADLSMSLLDLLEEGTINDVDTSAVKAFGKTQLVKIKAALPTDVLTKAEVATFKAQIEQIDGQIASLTSAFTAEMSRQNANKANIYANLDTQNTALNEQKNDYNEIMREKRSATTNAEAQDKMVSLAQERRAQNPNVVDGFLSSAQAEKAEAVQAAEDAQNRSEEALNGIDAKREVIDGLNMQLEDADNTIERIRSEYAAKIAALESQRSTLQNDIASLLDKEAPVLKDCEEYSKVFNAVGLADTAKKMALSGLIGIADSAVQDAKDKALKRIDEAYEKIMNLGDDLYKPSSREVILKIHKDLIKDLEKPDLSINLGVFETLLPMAAVKDVAQEVFQSAVINKVCAEVACESPDGRYFVGLPPKAEDFTAPKGFERGYTPPLREIVHFDTDDYEHILKTDDNKLIYASLLDYGQEVPAIWQRLLAPDAFVERGLDLQQIIEEHKEDSLANLLNGGSYPCSVGNYGLRYAGSEPMLHLWSLKNTKLPTCRNIRSVNIKSGGESFNLLAMADITFTDGNSATAYYTDKDLSEFYPSELGTLVEYNGTLGFNSVVNQIKKYFEDFEKNDGNKLDAKGKAYDNALLKRNQLGDYLRFVDLEESYQKGMDELEVKLEETREELRSKFALIDYVPEEDFDLADDKTFEVIMKKLDEGKNKIVKEMAPSVAALNPANEVLRDNINKLKNMLEALQLDNDETVQLTDNMSGDSILSEKIKTKTVDAEAINRYGNEAAKVMEDEKNNFEEPYCAIY